MRKSLSTVLAGMLLASSAVMADPAPFGLELGKATIADVTAKYRANRTGFNSYTDGDQYELDASGIPVDGLKSAVVIFNGDGKLVAVLSAMSKHKFDSVLTGLSGKYQVTSKDVPFVGDKKVELVDGDTLIFLQAPHLGFNMSLNYINKDLWAKYRAESADEQKQKEQAEAAQL
jgi:hypothetical protein